MAYVAKPKGFLVPLLFSLFAVVFILRFTQGNQQIVAWPIGLLIILFLWRDPQGKDGRKHAVYKAACAYRAALATSLLLAISLLLVGLSVKHRGTEGLLQRMAAGEALAHEGKLAEAVHAFEAIDVPEGMPLLMARKHHNCGVLLIRLQRLDEAAQHLGLALEYDGANVQAACLLATLEAQTKSPVSRARTSLEHGTAL